MSPLKQNTVQYRRIIASVFILALLFLALWAVSNSYKSADGYQTREISQAKLKTYIEEDGTFKEGLAAKDLLNLPDINDINELPASMKMEIIDLSNKSDIRLNATEDVLSYVENLDAEKAFSNLKEKLINKGWTYIESNSDVIGSFIKKGGIYNWLSVSCIEQGQQSIIVIQMIKN